MIEGTVFVDKDIYKQYLKWRRSCRGLNADYARKRAFDLHYELFYRKNINGDIVPLIEVAHPLMIKPVNKFLESDPKTGMVPVREKEQDVTRGI